ncbi:predicted protein [Phaeodactylum tricornutum CCAP 1055/1]|jgi:peptide methionine sulfoxide reductase MsrB|uniref:Uncharacterized protein n=1 Tax=Phaeodactylum tricornutum (strain CCAP 1055/1) TaxID=556484 RepID=B7FU18_PHATC|nr:predicted protein [Phaeodactylum tricornutum CCAP 1055/1]EEC49902.1 predicted protein [Phaeodactylum tricornutum CCAP 1055/1]|eukprot:XP_002178237.1 predicted protein [Phaeodactylum tricornutum CCAP 1055/1]
MKLSSISLSVALTMTTSSTMRSASAFIPHQQRAAVLPTGGATRAFLFDKLFSTSSGKLPVMAEEDVMSPKAHGTSEKPVQKNLRWNCDFDTADRICNFNRHYAEHAGYWQTTEFLKSIKEEEQPIKFYDSVTGVHLFTAPVGRTMEEFLLESQKHGWPSFRDEETVWDSVRCLKDGECVSVTGTHLGHNIPDKSGNRYCINLVSVAGTPAES